MPKYRVDFRTLAMMRGSLEVEAEDAGQAEDHARERAGDVLWSYEGTCEGEHGPAITNSVEIT